MVEIKEINYGSWGKCVQVTDGKLEFLATLDFGPRIIRFGKIGGENVFYEDVEKNITKEGMEEEFAKVYGEELGVWYIRGGHRLWTSPEALPRSYYPDNEPVAYEKLENGIRLIPPAQRANNFQMEIEITMPEDNCVHLIHKITNTGLWPVEVAPWALSVLAQGGTEIVPVPTRNAGFLENRNLSLWTFTKMTDPRVTWGDKYITLKQDPNNGDAFKVGLRSQHGYAAYFNFGDVFVKYFDAPEGIKLPDHDCNFETYTCAHMLEMESIGELKNLQPGDTVTHSECWSYYENVPVPANEEEMDKFFKEYVEY